MFVEAFNSGGIERIMALYEPGAVLVAEPGRAVNGREAIREEYAKLLEGDPRMTVETLGVYQAEDGIALMHGRWSMTSAGGETSGRNSEVVRRQVDGSWLFAVDNPFTPD